MTSNLRHLPSKPRVKTTRSPQSLSARLRGLLLDASLLASAHDMDAEAHVIGQLLIGLGADRKQLGMAMALNKLQRGRCTECLLLLEEEVLALEPGHELALAVQSRAWRMQGLSKGRELANVLLVSSSNPVVREIARMHV